MVSKENRMSDVLDLISKLDISPTMYKDAVEKYKNLGTYLQEKGIQAEFYPQGSFSLGTVVRPYKDNKDANFDLDAICQILDEKRETTPQDIKEAVESVFEESEKYKSKLTKCDKCCTINYAETNEIGFSIDIVSAVNEDEYTKTRLKGKSNLPQYLDTAIAISSKKEEDYKWATNNPKGFKEWFDNINRPFLENNPIQSRSAIFESYRKVFNSIEEIPIELERSALQRVIQILKRHRDVYFSKKKDGDTLKPISAIITTVVASIASTAQPSLNVLDLLKYVLSEFDIYSKRQILNEADFSNFYKNRNIVKRIEGIWIIENPVNPEDNLADSWNENPLLAKAFFDWAKCVSADFLESYEKRDEEYLTLLESALGSDFVRKSIDIKKYSSSVVVAKPITQSSQAKPWRI